MSLSEVARRVSSVEATVRGLVQSQGGRVSLSTLNARTSSRTISLASRAVPDGNGSGGGTDATAAINAAIVEGAALASGDRFDVVFEPGAIYRVDSRIDLLPGAQLIGNGALIDSTNLPNGSLLASNRGVSTAPTATPVSLASDADRGDTSIVLSTSSHGLEAGDDIYLTSAQGFRGLNISNGPHGELAVVASVDGATVYLESPLHDTYLVSNSATVRDCAMDADIAIVDCFFRRADQAAASAYGAWFTLVKNLTIDNCNFEHYTEAAIRFFFQRNASVINCRADYTWFTGTGTSYGVQAANAGTGLMVRGCHFFKARHALDVGTNGNGGVQRHFHFDNCHVEKTTTTDIAGAIATHFSEHGTISNCSVHGDGKHDGISVDTYDCDISDCQVYGAGIAVASRQDAERATGADCDMRIRIADCIVNVPPDAAATTHAVRVRGNKVDVSVTVNVATDGGGTNQPACIVQSQVSGQYVSDVTFLGCRIHGGYRAGILAQGVRRFRVSQCSISSSGSSTSGTGYCLEFADNAAATCTGVEVHGCSFFDDQGLTSAGVLLSAGMTSADICESNNTFSLNKGGAVNWSTSVGAAFVPFESARFLARERYEVPGGAYVSGSGTNLLHLDHASTSGWISIRVGGTEHGNIQYTGSVLQFFTARGHDIYTTSANGIQLRSAGASGKLDVDINGTEKLAINDTGFGFYGATPVAQQSITGATTQDQVDSLVAAGVAFGLWTDDR